MTVTASMDPATLANLVDEHRGLPGGMLPLLHAIQDRAGYIAPDCVPAIADGFNLSRAEVHGVISFYHHFRTEKPGRHVVQICRAEACQAMGGVTLEEHAKASLDVDYHQTSADGAVTLEAVYCLGNCACAPAIRVDNEILGRVSEADFSRLVGKLRGGASMEAADNG